MSLLFIDGFDSQDVTIKWSGFGTPNGYTAATRFAIGSAVVCSHSNGGTGGMLLKYLPASTPITINAIEFGAEVA